MRKLENQVFLAAGDITAEIGLIRSLKLPFKISHSNFTTTIETQHFKRSYITEERSTKVFAAKNMIKSDMDFFTANEWPADVCKSSLFYDEKLGACSYDKIYNIDLKNAYASILYIDGFISEKTYKYLLSLRKIDRLISIGIFAAIKKNFYYDSEGRLVDFSVAESETQGIFYWCVRRVNEIMRKCTELIGEDYLFFWVDGIFFRSKEKGEIIGEYLTGLGLKYSFDELLNFKCNNEEGKKYFSLSFEKSGKVKKYNIAKKDNNFFKIVSEIAGDEKKMMIEVNKLLK